MVEKIQQAMELMMPEAKRKVLRSLAGSPRFRWIEHDYSIIKYQT